MAAAKKEKNKGGAPKKPIDYPKLDQLCAIHCTGEECAAMLDCSYEHLNNTLKADGHGGFLDYFKQKSANGKMSLRRKQYTKAVDEGNPTMLIWLGKQWLGQKDSDDKPSDTTINNIMPVPNASSIEDWEQAAQSQQDEILNRDD